MYKIMAFTDLIAFRGSGVLVVLKNRPFLLDVLYLDSV